MRRKNFEYLKKHILPLSDEKSDFDIAKLEWTLDYINVTGNLTNCPCTQKIMDICHIRNKKNGNMTFVGNICVQRFMDIDARKLFTGLKKIKKNPKSKPNRDLIEYAFRKGFLYPGKTEYGFLKSIVMNRNLSVKQKNWLSFINRRIINEIVVQDLQNYNNLDNLNLSNVTCDSERSNTTLITTNDKSKYHNISCGSDAQYGEESELESSTDAENNFNLEIDVNNSESDDDIQTHAYDENDADLLFNFQKTKRLKKY